MLSESQERMLIACRPDQVQAVRAAFGKWDLDAVEIGKVTGDGRLKCRFHGQQVVDIPVGSVVDLCPVYQRPRQDPVPAEVGAAGIAGDVPVPENLGATLKRILLSPSIANKE
jgi:phosphoribosylformylglycinamidine synthase